MLSMFILGVAVLIGFILVARWYVGADPKTLLRALKWVGLGAATGVLAWLAFTGKLLVAAAALPAVLVWFVRLYTGLRYMQMFRRLFGTAGPGWSNPGVGGQSQNQGSGVRARFVVMHLDHATGQVSGEVLEGRFAGRQLDDLTLDEVLDLLGEAQVDADSKRLVESYLDRRSPGWQNRERRQTGPASSAMSHAEALRVLGLQEGATPADIKAAHRRLMSHVHPDHGGTDYLAQQINQAKDVLLGK